MAAARRARWSRQLLARLVPGAMLAGLVSALAPISPALAACVLTGTPPALVTITCGNTVTDGTTVTTSPNAGTNASTYNIGANVTGSVTGGSTVTGMLLAIASTLPNGGVSFTNNGTITSSPSGGQILTITGNGGGASYSGSGSINGTIANSQSLAVGDNTPNAGLVSVNMTGGSLTSTGNTVQAMQVFTAGTGGITVTTALGTSILLVDTASGSSNRGMYVNSNNTTVAAGDIVIDSGSSITGNVGGASLGNIFAIDVNQSGPADITVTSSGVIDVTRAADKCCTGIQMTNSSTSGNIKATANANITGSLAGAGVFAQFNNPANTGTGDITISNGVAVSAGIGVAIDGGSNGNHLISVGSGASVQSRQAPGIRVNGATSNLTLNNAGAISSLTTDGVSVTGNVILNMTGGSIAAAAGFAGINAGGRITGTNAGTISGSTGITTAAAGSNLTNAGIITGTGGTAILFIGAGNTLTLHNGTNITGTVNGGANATFQLGGTTGTPTFNASGLGAQYTNFNTFNKIDAGQWTLSGTGAQTWNVSGGTLTGTTTSASGNKVMSNNSNFAFDQNVAGTYSSVISGAGNLIKNGTGAVTLGVAQTYSGTTTINGGSLVLGGSNFVPSGTALAVNSPGTFDLNNFNQTVGDLSGSGAIALGTGTLTAGGAASTAFSGAIGGGGALIKAGAGTLSLTGANNYTGGTTINAGILQLGNGGAGGSIVGDVANNSLLAVNRSDTFSYAGVISGNGAFQQNGTGTTIFTGANTYLGGTTINAGILQIGNGGTTGSFVGNVLNNGTFAINHSDAVTFGNVISGTGLVPAERYGHDHLHKR